MAHVHSDKLMCGWHQWRVVDDHTLAVDIPPTHCTDMTGCIETAKALLPAVSRIEVWAGDQLDMVYEYTRDGSRAPIWEALDIDARRRR